MDQATLLPATEAPAAPAAVPAPATTPPAPPRPARLRPGLLRTARILDACGLAWIGQSLRVVAGTDRAYELRVLLRQAGLPILALVLAVLGWHLLARNVAVGSLHLPTPAAVAERALEQWRDWRAEGVRRAEYEAMIVATATEQGMTVAEVKAFLPFERRKVFVDQLWLSVQTALFGVGLAVLVAIPLGILAGLSGAIHRMSDPLVQMFKPVSPLAWFPVVYLLINRAMPGNEGPIAKSFLIAALVVALCALWPALINTANGVANVDKDHLNVARVLNLGWFTTVRRIILPASLPAIITGVRLSLGVGWMVLIAAEMMAVSPGLGGFIWDWYQSSNEVALSYLVLAVLVVGLVGWLLDRLMVGLQRLTTRGRTAEIR